MTTHIDLNPLTDSPATNPYKAFAPGDYLLSGEEVFQKTDDDTYINVATGELYYKGSRQFILIKQITITYTT